MAHVFVIDDKFDKFAETLRHALSEHDLAFFANGGAALESIEAGRDVDVVLLDIGMPPQLGDEHDREGIEVLKRLKEMRPELPVIMLTVHSDVDTVVEAVQRGAFYYLTKPPDLEKLTMWLNRAIENASLRHNVAALGQAIEVRDSVRRKSSRARVPEQFGSLIGTSPVMRALFSELEAVADMDVRLLLLGETGTGKDAVAREIHEHSARKKGPFIAVNCAALPEHLLESELFGHEKGAFTGAVSRRAGKFELADGGTLFLDEVGDMPLAIQAKLLRVLENGEVWRLGAPEPIYVKVRVLCATNTDLAEAVAAGAFREDLYYRINVYPLELPPLRDRASDVHILANHFLEQTGLQTSLTDSALEKLASHDWPGNVRELQNVIVRAAAKSRGQPIEPEHITFADVPHRTTTSSADSLWNEVIGRRELVTDLTAFRNKHGERALRDILRRALRQEKDIRAAGRLIGYLTDDDTHKYANLRQWMRRLNITKKSAMAD